MRSQKFAVCLAIVFSFCFFAAVKHASAAEYLVATPQAYSQALAKAKAGDVIKLADGEWRNFEILFTGEGKKGNPIRLTAQTKGRVILSGQSNLRLAGNYLEVSGLVFKNGYTPTQEVISFRKNNTELANNSRVTEVVIDNFNQPERQEADFWVMLYGKNNRFDHSHLVGKRNKGVTMAVKLNSPESRENNHRIDHNYFGPRPILGSNGGETLRIGTSHFSRTDSKTIVENNYFDRCDGELEVISSKSASNVFRNNTFYKSRGTLTMRHGNNTLVEGNVFFGDNEDHTGGIRVINARQTVRNNYMQDIKGSRFGGALVVMNGVPNSPINRYDRVRDSVIENNSLVNSDNIQLAAGSDEERSAVPLNTTFSNNLIAHNEGRDVFTVYDDVSGIAFSDNIVSGGPKPGFADGFEAKNVKLARAANGLFYPADNSATGVSRDLRPTTKDMTGVSWYPKAEPIVPFASGKTHKIKPGESALFDAVKKAKAGDVIELASGNYAVTKFIRLDKPITVKGVREANISFRRSTMFEILNGGSLQLINLNITGAESPDYKGNSVIRTSPYSMNINYRIEIIDSEFEDLDVNQAFNVISVAKNTFADRIIIKNSKFSDVSGAIAKLDKEDDDYGIYNAEYLTISGSSFENVEGDIVDYYRGGSDESTFGPHFSMTDSTVKNVGNGKRNKSASSLYLHGVQVTNVAGNRFIDSAPFLINHTVGEPKTLVENNRFSKTGAPRVFELNSGLQPTAVIKNNRGLK